MEQGLAARSLSDPETAKLLWERWTHLEKLLVATLFAMFITTTVGLFAVAGDMQENESFRVDSLSLRTCLPPASEPHVRLKEEGR